MFLDDEEKIVDLQQLSKKEFLATYSYLSEKEYDDTLLGLKIVEQLKSWIEQYLGREVKKIELLIPTGNVMFCADGVLWSFLDNWEGDFVCTLQEESICLRDILDDDVMREVLDRIGHENN